MKILIFGASGQTGKEAVKQALERGDIVKAFVRHQSKLDTKHENLTVYTGDVLDKNCVEDAVQDVNAVLIFLGAKSDTSPTVLTDGTANIVSAMQKSGVKRLVVLSSYPMSGSVESMNFLNKVMPEEQIAAMQPMIDDKAGQERVVRGSELEWTIVKPVFLNDGPKTGVYRSGESIEVNPESNISRADVADFMLKLASNEEMVGKSVMLAY